MPDPYATCCFISSNVLYLNIFHNYSRKHYHFIYDFKLRKVIGKINELTIECGLKNFPLKSFYSKRTNEIYTFYRDANSFIINANDSSDYQFEQKFVDLDLEQMYLINGYNCSSLIVKSSMGISLLRLELIEIEVGITKRMWKIYLELES